MRRVKVALTAGLTLLATAIGVTLLRSPMSVAGTNRPGGAPEQPIASFDQSASVCQAHEVLPRETSAIRVWLYAAAGPRVSVVVSSGGRPIASGVRGSNWVGGSVTVPVQPLPRSVSGVTVCVSFRIHDETVIVQGNTAPAGIAARSGGQALGGQMWIEYLRGASRSWVSLAPQVARRMGFGRAAAGTWIVFAALALGATVAVLASGLVVKELR
jgi:hypothetical protein